MNKSLSSATEHSSKLQFRPEFFGLWTSFVILVLFVVFIALIVKAETEGKSVQRLSMNSWNSPKPDDVPMLGMQSSIPAASNLANISSGDEEDGLAVSAADKTPKPPENRQQPKITSLGRDCSP